MLDERAVRCVIVSYCGCVTDLISHGVNVLVSMRRSVNMVADRCAQRQ